MMVVGLLAKTRAGKLTQGRCKSQQAACCAGCWLRARSGKGK